MANPIYKTITAAGSYVFELDYYINPFNAAYEVEVPTGTTVSYGLNGTLDPVNQTVGTGYGVPVAPNPTWSPIVAAGTTTTTNPVNQTTPIRAMQLVVASISGGPIYLKIVQPFSIN